MEPEYLNHNETDFANFTIPLNATGNDVDNGNASRHFADQPNTAPATINYQHAITIFVSSVILCALLLYLVLFIHDYCSQNRRIISLRHDANRDGVLPWPCRPDLLSVIPNGRVDQMTFQSGDDIHILGTPSSLYAGDMLPSYSDSSGRERIFSDTITTPLSNNSVITMTMKNDHLIVETEERVPVNLSNYSFLNADEMYTNYLATAHGLSASAGIDEYDCRDSDDADGYSNDRRNQHICTVENEDRRTFYEPTTSRQADEEDQHVELFHKNIIVFPTNTTTTSATSIQTTVAAGHQSNAENVPSCSYGDGDYVADAADNDLTYSASDGAQADINTGLTQSDQTGSASSNTSRHVRNDYSYGNQSEYHSFELPLRKHRSAIRLSMYDKTASSSSDPIEYSSSSLQPLPPDHSVLQLTDCSSSEFSEPSK